MNARLNASLVGLEINIKKMTEYKNELNFDRKKMQLEESPELDIEIGNVEGMNPLVIETLKEASFDTPRKILQVTSKELSKETGLSVELAEEIMEKLHKIRT